MVTDEKNQPQSVSAAFAHLIYKLVDRYLPEEVNYPECAKHFWLDIRFWCAAVGGLTFVQFYLRGLSKREEINRFWEFVGPFVWSSMVVIFSIVGIGFFSWLVYHMSPKMGRLRAYFLGLLLPSIVITWSSVID